MTAQQLEAFLDYHKSKLENSSDDKFIKNIEAFTQELVAVEDYRPDTLNQNKLNDYKAYFSISQKRYLAIKELDSNNKLIKYEPQSSSDFSSTLPDSFSINSYERVQDLIDFVDFSQCKNAVMVGCGAFPATLLWLGEHFPNINYIGLDVIESCIKKARELTSHLQQDNFSFHTINGNEYNFNDADFIYIANHVTPKKTVLETIAKSAKPGLQVVIREPTLKGELFAEVVREDLPAGYTSSNEGKESTAFLSYDLCLTFK